MNEVKHVTLAQVREFLAGTADVGFKALGEDAERYRWISRVLRRFGYSWLSRADRGVLLRYLQRMTGYSRQQVTRLVRQYVQTGGLRQGYGKPRAGFAVRYRLGDVELLAEVDTLHNTLSGPATVVLLRRAWQVYGDSRFERLAGISVSHLYNLRQRSRYRARRRHFTKTRPTVIAIGLRKAPQPQSRPGFIRIDTPSTRAMRTASRGCITSTRWTASPSGRLLPAARRSARRSCLTASGTLKRNNRQ